MDNNFLNAYKDTVADEGVTLKIDPNDRGGQTWKGIARNIAPESRGINFAYYLFSLEFLKKLPSIKGFERYEKRQSK